CSSVTKWILAAWWLMSTFRSHSLSCPAIFRTRLMIFGGQELGQITGVGRRSFACNQPCRDTVGSRRMRFHDVISCDTTTPRERFCVERTAVSCRFHVKVSHDGCRSALHLT